MALHVGERLGPYEILGLIGAATHCAYSVKSVRTCSKSPDVTTLASIAVQHYMS